MSKRVADASGSGCVTAEAQRAAKYRASKKEAKLNDTPPVSILVSLCCWGTPDFTTVDQTQMEALKFDPKGCDFLSREFMMDALTGEPLVLKTSTTFETAWKLYSEDKQVHSWMLLAVESVMYAFSDNYVPLKLLTFLFHL